MSARVVPRTLAARATRALGRTRAAALAAAVIVGVVPAVARAGNGVDLVRFAPDDVTAFVALDVAGARSSPLFDPLVTRLCASARAPLICAVAGGAPPLRGLDTYVLWSVGFDTGERSAPQVEIAEGPGIEALVARIARAPDTIAARYRGVAYSVVPGGAVARVGRRLVLAPKEDIERVIDRLRGKATNVGPTSRAATLRAAIRSTEVRRHAWLVSIPDHGGPPPASAGPGAVPLDAIAVAVRLSSELAFRAALVSSSESSAQALIANLQGALPGLTQWATSAGLEAAARSLQIDREAAVVHLTVSMTKDELERVIAQFAGRGGASTPSSTP